VTLQLSLRSLLCFGPVQLTVCPSHVDVVGRRHGARNAKGKSFGVGEALARRTFPKKTARGMETTVEQDQEEAQ